MRGFEPSKSPGKKDLSVRQPLVSRTLPSQSGHATNMALMPARLAWPTWLHSTPAVLFRWHFSAAPRVLRGFLPTSLPPEQCKCSVINLVLLASLPSLWQVAHRMISTGVAPNTVRRVMLMCDGHCLLVTLCLLGTKGAAILQYHRRHVRARERKEKRRAPQRVAQWRGGGAAECARPSIPS